MAQISGGRLVAKALKREGVEAIFSLTGGHIMDIYFGCREEGIRLFDTRHEASAGFAADAFARVSGKPGVLVTTAGPGVTDATSPMAEALCHGTPLIHIGGAAAERRSDTGEEQDVDTMGVMSAVCKWARRVVYTERIPEYLSMAFRSAMAPSKGPVYLEIGHDVLQRQVDEAHVEFPENYRSETEAFGDPELVEAAAEVLIGAQRPVMMLGFGARFSTRNRDAVAELAHHLQIPVSTQTAVKGMFADESEDPLFRLSGAQAGADVVLMLHVENDFLVNWCRPPFFAEGVKLIQVHPDAAKIGYNAPAAIGILGGATPVAGQLLEAVKARTGPRSESGWVGEAERLVAELRAPFSQAFASQELPMNPGRCAFEVSRFLNREGRDWTVVCDGGDAGVWMRWAAVARRPGQILTMGPHGTLGCGPGFSLGAWAANGKPVLYYTGDGSFGLYPMEFDTFDRHGVPVVCVISNDSAWGMIKHAMALYRPNQVAAGHVGVDLAPMRAYEKMTALWDGYGQRIRRPEEIVPALQRAASEAKPAILNVEVDQVTPSPVTRGLVPYE